MCYCVKEPTFILYIQNIKYDSRYLISLPGMTSNFLNVTTQNFLVMKSKYVCNVIIFYFTRYSKQFCSEFLTQSHILNWFLIQLVTSLPWPETKSHTLIRVLKFSEEEKNKKGLQYKKTSFHSGIEKTIFIN